MGMRIPTALSRALQLLALCCVLQEGAAQDTLSVFFEFGKWRIPHEEQATIAAIPYHYDLSAVDSVQFIGMADSIGSLSSNLKLSQRRALEVASQCRRHFSMQTPVSTLAMGAIDRGDRAQNRRVDIVFHMDPTLDRVQNLLDSSGGALPLPGARCYIIDCDLIGRFIVTLFRKGRREFVEVEIPGRLTVPNRYGAVLDMKLPRYRRTAGTNEHIRLKWTRKPSRNKKAPAAYTTSMPKADFDRYGVLIEKQGDCVVPILDTCMRVDHALMEELQHRSRLSRSKGLRVRVPRHAVDNSARYFHGPRPDVPITWEQRDGKKHAAFYYTKIPVRKGFALDISREMVSCADHCDTSLFGGWPAYPPCAPADRALKMIVETGYHGQWNVDRPYLAIGLMRSGTKGLVSGNIGLDSDARPLASLRYQYHFLQFDPQELIPTERWIWPSD